MDDLDVLECPHCRVKVYYVSSFWQPVSRTEHSVDDGLRVFIVMGGDRLIHRCLIAGE
jgi:hypothetical protein